MTVQLEIADRVAEILVGLEGRGEIPEGAAVALTLPVSYVCATVLAEALADLGVLGDTSDGGGGGASPSPFEIHEGGWRFTRPTPQQENGR